MSETTLFTVTVDTEEEWDWSGSWPATNPSVANLRALPKFQRLCSQYGVAATYFVNLAVVEDATARQTLAEIAGPNDVEVGMHIHPWNTPPVALDANPTARMTFLHNLPPNMIRQKLELVYDSLCRIGFRPTSFRGGRYSTGGSIHEFLQERGFVADCSVVPFTTWPDDGAPDYRHRDLKPTRIPPSRPGLSPLWEIPLTLAYSRTPFRFWRRCLEWVEQTPMRHLRLVGIAERLRLVRKVWLNFEIADPYDWVPFLKLLQAMSVPCICFTVHSSSLAIGPGPYTRTPADEDRIWTQIERVFATMARLPGFVPATASQVARQLEERHARIRN